MESKKFRLNKSDVESIARGATMAAGGAICAYLIQLLPNVDMGEYTPIVVAIASILLNSGRKFFSGK